MGKSYDESAKGVKDWGPPYAVPARYWGMATNPDVENGDHRPATAGRHRAGPGRGPESGEHMEIAAKNPVDLNHPPKPDVEAR